MLLIKTTSQIISINEEDEDKQFILGYRSFGDIIEMNEPKVGERLTVRFTSTSNPEDWEEYTTSPIVEITKH